MRESVTARSYYEILGVTAEADAETIKRAFREQARALHPDVSDDPEAAEKFRELSEAYGVLSRQSTRLLYDQFGYRGRGNGWFTPEGAQAAGDFLRRRSAPVAEVLVDEFDAERGVRRKVQWQRTERCGSCDGDGAAPGAMSMTCPACGGSGRRRVNASLSDGERLIQIEDCAQCSGRGRFVTEACPDCDGAGERTIEEKGDVEVPAGASDGQRLPVYAGATRDVVVRVLATPRDHPLVRYVAAVGLLVALLFLWILLR